MKKRYEVWAHNKYSGWKLDSMTDSLSVAKRQFNQLVKSAEWLPTYDQFKVVDTKIMLLICVY